MAPKKAGKAAKEELSVQELFWQTLCGEDLVLARSTGCGSPQELEMEKKKKEERRLKAEKTQQSDLWKNEKRRQWEKEEENKAKMKQREDQKWQREVEAAKKRAFSEGVLEAEDWGDAYWVKLPDTNWKEVQQPYYCHICNKQLADHTLEAHIASDAHKKRVSWAVPPTSAPGAPGKAAAPAPSAPRAPAAPRFSPDSLPNWQSYDEATGFVRCVPCGKVLDDNHIMTGDHERRLNAWIEHEKLQKSGYPAPKEPHLAWVPSVEGDASSERWLRCLLCKKFVNDETSHSGTLENQVGSNEHKKNLRNYDWHKATVQAERQKYHPEPTCSAVANRWSGNKQPSPAPWAATATPSPAPWARPAAEEKAAPPAAPWDVYEAPKGATPYPTHTRLPSASEMNIEEC